MATFPGSPPNPLGVKVELNLASVWTDITQFVQHRSDLQITNMGRADESSSISPCQLQVTLKNDGRFTPKLSSGAYFPNILRNTQVRVSVGATSSTGTAYPGSFTTVTGGSTSPTAFTTWAGTGVPAGTYTVPWSVTLSGTTGSNDVNNFILKLPDGTLVTSVNPSTPGTYAQTPVTFTTGGGNLFIQSGSHNATTGAVYSETATGVTGSAYRFFGEISSWPPGSDISGRDNYVTITASGIWRRISASSASIGSAYSRYTQQLTGTSVPATAWMMEDGNGAAAFVTTVGAGGAATFTTASPSFAADGTSFPGCDALPQFNGARITAPVSSAAAPTSNCIRFALSVPAGGDSNANGGNWNIAEIDTAGTFAKLEVYLLANGTLQFDGVASGGSILFTTTTTTNVQGTPLLVSAELTPSGGSVNWALRIIKPSAGAVLESRTGTRASSAIGAVSQVKLNRSGTLSDTALGALGVFYAVPSITTAASAIGGWAGEFAVDRFTRITSEFGIASEVIGSASATMGPQVDDTLAAVLQSVEDTDGGLLYESRTQFGLGYRTLGSLQNQSVAATLSYTAGVLGAPPAPAYDDQLLRNQVVVTNYDGYAALAQLTSGALSIAPPPNGAGVYAGTAQTNASSHSQVNAIAQQRMFTGTVDDVRYPTVTMNMARAQAASLFAVVPSLRIGDYFQLTNLPATLGGSSTSKQLAWGYSETISHNSWVITFNAIPETSFETTFSPGVYSVTQATSGAVAAGSAVGSSVSGAQLGDGSVPASALSASLSARTIGGMTSFVAASTPYDWSFAVSGTPADVTYFICTEAQSQPVSVGDTFSNTSGLGGPFTVTSVDPPSAGNVTVHFQPDASSVMSAGTVQGGKEGDTWVNTSGGNQVNIWHNGAWTPVTWTGSSVIAASSITSSLLAAGSVIAGTIAAGAIDGMTITGANIIADGSSGEILVYSGTPATGNLIGSWSGASGTDAHSNAFPAGLGVETGGLVLYDQGGTSPSSVTGAGTFYSRGQGNRPAFLSSQGADNIIPRSDVNVAQFSMNTQTTPIQMSAPLNYRANEGAQSSEYEIEIDGQLFTATSGSGTLPDFNFAFAVDGSTLGGTITIGHAFLALNESFWYTWLGRLSILTSGAGGTCLIACTGLIQLATGSPNVGNTGVSWPAALNTGGTTKSFDSTSNHTLTLVGAWVSNGGSYSGHHAVTYRSRITRRD